MDSNATNKIGQDFTTFQLLLFTLPSFMMNVFTQIFRSLDDALFISRYVGERALASLNLISPIMSTQFAIICLFSLGSSNMSAKMMGENKQLEAKQIFSRIIISSLVFGTILALLTNVFAEAILIALGADASMMPSGIVQLRFMLSITPIAICNNVFSGYYSTAGNPKMGMICSIVNGITNISLDVVLVAIMKVGVLGASLATLAGELVVFVIGIVFFCNRNNEIYYVKPEGKYVETSLESAKYALPQAVNSLSIAFASLVTNNTILSMIGPDGIAANAIIGDIRMIITSGLFGMTGSISPVIAYNYGNHNVKKLRKTFFSVMQLWAVSSAILMAIGFLFRRPMVGFFMSENSTKAFEEMALFGLTIEIFSVPFASGCVLLSRSFIALGNMRASTVISAFRNLIIKIIVIIVLPKVFGETGIWMSIPVGEFLSFLFGLFIVWLNRDNYGYGVSGLALRIPQDDQQ